MATRDVFFDLSPGFGARFERTVEFRAAPRVISGKFAASSKTSDVDLLRSLLPSQSHPFVGGQPMDPVWHRFFTVLVDITIKKQTEKLTTAVEQTREDTRAQAEAVSAVSQTLKATVAATEAIREVAVASALPGSGQIPSIPNMIDL